MKTKKYEIQIEDMNEVLEIIKKIAKEELFINTLERRNRDRFDFHDVHVLAVKDALIGAFLDGMKYQKYSKRRKEGKK
jgi:hypothetical protein